MTRSMEAVIRLVAIRCAHKRGISNEDNDDRLGLCAGTAVISRDRPGTRGRRRARRGLGRRRAGAGRRGGRRFRGLCRRTVDRELLGIAAVEPSQTRAQTGGGACRECRQQRACAASPDCNRCTGPACSVTAGCSIATISAKGCGHAAGAAAGIRAFADLELRRGEIFF